VVTGAKADGLGQYSDETATILAHELLRDANGETNIAVVSAPSVFVQLKNILVRYSFVLD